MNPERTRSMVKKEPRIDTAFQGALERLQDTGTTIPTSTLFTLSDVNRQELQHFAETWTRLPAERRRYVTRAMGELAEENIEADFNRLFRYLLDDEDPQVREDAINGLWEDEDVCLINPLIGAMRSDAAARVRAAAASSLGRFVLLSETKRIPSERGEQIGEALLSVIRNGGEDELVRRRAIESIAYRGDETVRDIVESAYATDDAKMRASAIFAMGRSADPYWRRTVAQELWSADPQIRFEAARAAGELEYKVVVARLIELLEDPDREVQEASITALGQIGGRVAREALLTLLEGDDEIARELAQDALDELEFARDSEMLLYDMDLTNDDQEMQQDPAEGLIAKDEEE
jgi:HEAT repeat protein